jgi:3-hydroxybutyryl-CoA dehydratase
MHVYFEDFEVGAESQTAGRTITEADIVNFAGLTGDWYELHTNVEYAKSTQFGQRIAHGALIFSIASALSVRAMPPGNTLIAFYGVDKLRFVRPVFIGDTVWIREKVVETVSRDATGGVVATQSDVVNQNGVVVLSYLARTLWRKRPQ